MHSSEAPSDYITADAEAQQIDSQNVGFIDNTTGELLDMGQQENAIAKIDGTPDVTLGNFLSRPTLIQNIAWNMSDTAGITNTIKPWHLFFNNTKIKKKIDNYAFVRCRLKVKVMLNASPFLYGMAFHVYNPLEGNTWNPVRASSSFAVDAVTYSQMPHIKIFPAASSGGEMTLPFFYHKNWLSLTSAQDLQDMGTLRFMVINALKSANGATGETINIQVYAWAEEVELMGPTVALAVQAKDEYDTSGVISSPATSIASFAQKFESLPVIGRFAKATNLGATAVGKIASLFGFTNVPVIDPIHAFTPNNLPGLASAELSTQLQKLTLDPKQELSVDPSIHGLPGVDELDINYIKQKESLLTTVAWNSSDTLDTQLFNARVTATLSSTYSEVGATRVANTPMSYIGALFQYWRGDIIFRFKFICTKFHKGRVRITYDPVGRIDTDADSQNVAFTQIVDIGEENDVEVVVPYHQATAWLRQRAIGDQTWSPGNNLAPDTNYENGLINLRVQNYLNGPTATSSIYVAVFVRAGENFEYAVPSETLGNLSMFSVQGLEQDAVNLAPIQVIAGDTHSNAHPDRYLLNHGEVCKSLRMVLHRSSLAEIINYNDMAANTYAVNKQKFMPMPIAYGFDPNGISTANQIVGAATAPFNFVPTHPLPYITSMFKGYRGTINHKINSDTKTYPVIDELRYYRHPYGISSSQRKGYTPTTLAAGANLDNRLRSLNMNLDRGSAGLAITAQRTNNGLEVSLPDFNRFNFHLVNPAWYSVPGTADQGAETTYALSFVTKPTDATGQGTSSITFNRYVSSGPDFTALFWLCAPTIDVYTSVPTAP